jgi:HEAT repeat protein
LDDAQATEHEMLRALSHEPGRDALDRIVPFLTARDEFVRRSAVEALGSHPDGLAEARRIADALKDRSPYVRRAAAELAARWEQREFRDAVKRLLREGESASRIVGLTAIDRLWSTEDFAQIFDLFRTDPHTGVRKSAGRVLRNHADSRNWRLLFEAFAMEPIPRHRIWACELARSFGDQSITAAVQRLLQDSDGHVRRAAHEAMQALASES